MNQTVFINDSQSFHAKTQKESDLQQHQDKLRILIKYIRLDKRRQHFNLLSEDVETLKSIQATDEAYKQQIYSSRINDITEFHDEIFENLLPFLSQCKENLYTVLPSILSTYYDNIKKWEINLSKHIDQLSTANWKTRIIGWGKKLWNCVYRNSFTGFSQQVLTLLDIKNKLIKISCGLLGAGLDYTIGYWGLLRLLFINTTAQSLHECFSTHEIDDKKAVIRPYRGWLPHTMGFSHLIRCSIAATETYLSRDYRYLLQTLSNIGCSEVTLLLAQQVIPKLKSHPQSPPDANQILARLIISNLAMQSSEWLLDFLSRPVMHQMVCNSFQALIKQLSDNNSDWHTVQCHHSPYFFSRGFPITLSWGNPSGTVKEGHCYLTIEDREAVVQCDPESVVILNHPLPGSL